MVENKKQKEEEPAIYFREETEHLYRTQYCVICVKNLRTIVTLPCGHFSLCKSCVSRRRHCPAKNCIEVILNEICTYLT